MTILLAGDYQIDYSVSIIGSLGSAIAVAVNGGVDPSTVVGALVAGGSQVIGQAILTLVAGDVITLTNPSGIPFTTDSAPEVGAQMTIDN